MDAVNDTILSLAGSPWIYFVALALVIIDGFFPPVPSESVIVALSSLGIATGSPNLIAVVVIAAFGAMIGDNIAYALGRWVGVERFAWMRRPRVARAFQRAGRGLAKRTATLVLTARYVPVGRVAVNMTAGATHLPRRRFIPLTVLSGVTWALYSVLIGVLVGAWMHGHPVLGAAIAIVFALALGFAVDAILNRIAIRRDAATARATSVGTPD
ncbi:MAG: DedA family protein [Microbacteriaceae bacterium]